jgi:hypothetical protein
MIIALIMILILLYYFMPTDESLAPNLARFLGTKNDSSFKSKVGPGYFSPY